MPIGPWGRFNRTSFQQQLKLVMSSIFWSTFCSFNRTSFQQQLKLNSNSIPSLCSVLLQSYILSTTTETRTRRRADFAYFSLQSYILSTTTETASRAELLRLTLLQSYILSTTTETSFRAFSVATLCFRTELISEFAF